MLACAVLTVALAAVLTAATSLPMAVVALIGIGVVAWTTKRRPPVADEK